MPKSEADTAIPHIVGVKVSDSVLVGVFAKVDELHTGKVGVCFPIRMGDEVVQHFIEVKGKEGRQTGTTSPKGCPIDALVFLDQFVASSEIALVASFEGLLDALGVVLDALVGFAVECNHIVSFPYTIANRVPDYFVASIHLFIMSSSSANVSRSSLADQYTFAPAHGRHITFSLS